jgi:hypothetical protein
MWVERSELGSGTGGIERRDEGNAAAREKERVKAPEWAVHGDKEVAAGGGFGSPWRARARPEREGNSGGESKRRHLGTCRSLRWSSGSCAGGQRRRQSGAEGEAVVPEVEEAGRSQKDLFVISKKFKDPSVI